jgi:S1-C subfamily serine protease
MERVRQRSQRGFGHAIVFFVVVVLVALIAVAIADLARHGDAGGIDVSGVAAAVGPSVVSVNHAGSGVAISPNEIVTAAHLVDGGGSNVTVSTDKWSAGATVAGYDRAADVALLEIVPGGPRLVPAGTDDSQTVRVKMSVAALGSAGPTRGSVKSVTTDDLTIAAPVRDTAIGGPIVDANHDVVAIARHMNGETIVDALPWNAIVPILNTIDGGHSTPAVHVGPRAALGVTVVPLTGSRGARVTALLPGGAAVAGIATGDVIATVNGVSVASQADIDSALDPVAPGGTVPVAVFNAQGVLRTLSVVTR